MKKIFCVLLFIPLITRAQQDWLWARTSTINSGNQCGDQITTDAFGNIYVLGSNQGNSQFASASLDSGIFLLKYDINGSLLWGKNLLYSPARIEADQVGNVYLGGSYTLNLTTETDTFLSEGKQDMYLVKMDANGTEQWARSYGNAETNIFSDLATDSKGNIVLGGGYQGDSIIFYNYIDTLSSPWNKFFVAKISSDGITKWVTTGPAKSDTLYYYFANLIEINATDNIFVMGIGSQCNTGSPGCSADFLAKIDTSGNQYFHKWGGSIYGSGSIIEFKLDALDNIYFYQPAKYSGTYRKSDQNFNSLWISDVMHSYACYHYNDFAVDAQGNSVLVGFIQYQEYQGSPEYGCSTVSGQVVVSGYTCHVNQTVPDNYDVILTTFNTSGQVTTLKQAGGKNSEMISDVTIRNGAVYIAGAFNEYYSSPYYSDTLVLGTHTLQNNNIFKQAFVAKMGNYLLTGIPELKAAQHDLHVFPNPAGRSIKIHGLASISEVKFNDMFGKSVLTVTSEQNDPEFDISMLSQGVYIIQLNSKDGITHLKIIKE